MPFEVNRYGDNLLLQNADQEIELSYVAALLWLHPSSLSSALICWACSQESEMILLDVLQPQSLTGQPGSSSFFGAIADWRKRFELSDLVYTRIASPEDKLSDPFRDMANDFGLGNNLTVHPMSYVPVSVGNLSWQGLDGAGKFNPGFFPGWARLREMTMMAFRGDGDPPPAAVALLHAATWHRRQISEVLAPSLERFVMSR